MKIGHFILRYDTTRAAVLALTVCLISLLVSVCSPHRYRFTLYALDHSLELEAGASKRQVLDAMQGHVLAQGQLVGTYQR